MVAKAERSRTKNIHHFFRKCKIFILVLRKRRKIIVFAGNTEISAVEI